MSTWRGVPLSDIYGSTSPWGAPEFPLVAPSYNHAVLYHVGRGGPCNGDADKPPSPQRGRDKWDKDCVRMPCSDHSLYPVQEEDGSTNLAKRWDIIKSALQKPIRSSRELAEAICSYNTKFKSQWNFRGLHHLFNEICDILRKGQVRSTRNRRSCMKRCLNVEEAKEICKECQPLTGLGVMYLEEEESEYFFTVTLPAVAKIAIALPNLVQSPIPLLRQHKNRSISLTQEQIASLLANAFFCTFPRRNTSKKTSEYASYPYINFNGLYEASPTPSVMEKLKCICHYFRRVCTKVPVGVVTFTRRSVEPARCPKWAASAKLLGGTPLHVNSSGTIEDDGAGLIQVDFANKYLGGGVLNHGCVQEEIRFVICPELLVSMLFTEVLRPTEALLIIGCERYSRYSGYSSTFQWTGDYEDGTPHDSSGRRRCAVLAIDALPFSDERHQYRAEFITRELNKEERAPVRPGVATGNWGCGAFGGSAALKSLLQLMACTEARRPVAYYTFGEVELRNEIVQMYNFLSQHHVTVGQLYKYIIKFSETNVSRSDLYAYIHQLHTDESRTSETRAAPSPVEEKSTASKKHVTPLTRTDSPEMFSSGEINALAGFIDLEKGEGTLHVNIETTKQVEPPKSNGKEPSCYTYQPSQSAHKQSISVPDSWTVTPQTTSLFEDMTKFDAENSKVQFKQNSLNRGEKCTEDLHRPMVVSEIDKNVLEPTTASTMIVDETVENFIDNVTTVGESLQKDETEGQEQESNTSEKVAMDCDKSSAKKMARKITDYFNKKF